MALKGSTVAVYMGKTVAAKVSDQLISAGLDKDTPVVAVENASRSNEAIFKGNITDLAEFSKRDEVSGPVLFVIGKVVDFADIQAANPLRPKPQLHVEKPQVLVDSKIAA